MNIQQIRNSVNVIVPFDNFALKQLQDLDRIVNFYLEREIDRRTATSMWYFVIIVKPIVYESAVCEHSTYT